MKKVIVLVLLSILFFVVDNALMPFIAIRGIYPSVFLIFCILYSIQNGKWEGMWLGVFCGLLQDFFFSNIFGINAFLNMGVCVAAGIIGTKIFKEKKLVPVACCFALSLIKGMLMMLFLNYYGVYIDITRVFFVSVYNMIISIFMFKYVYNLCQEIYMQIRWKF
ncbi:MAG: rod shape-determining protein MreD [Solirubrobacterales bacterium]